MILVTGGTGLLGAHVLIDLLKGEEKLRAIYRTEKSLDKAKNIFSFYGENIHTRFNEIEWIKADILDLESLIPVFQDIKKVYHCAALVSFMPKEKKKIIQNNVEGTSNVINLALENNIEAFCHVSSIAALGESENGMEITESNEIDSLKDKSGYAISKYLAEKEAWRGAAEGLNVVIVNPSVILGPGDWHNGAGELFHKIYRGLKFYTRGTTGFVDVRDVSKIMIELLNKELYNQRFVVSEGNYSYKEIFEKIAFEMNVKAPSINVGKFISSIAWRVEALKSLISRKRPIITRESVMSAFSQKKYSSEKLRKKTAYSFINIDNTIKHMAASYLNHG